MSYNHTFLTPHDRSVINYNQANRNGFIADNGLSHPARTIKDNRDVVLRVMTAGGQGGAQLLIVKRLSSAPDILMSTNHILLILQEISFRDIVIISVPKLIGDLHSALAPNLKNSVEDILYMVLQAFEGAVYLHQNRIAHRDFFLNNIAIEWMPHSLVQRTANRPRAYIIDFETAVEVVTQLISDPPVPLNVYGRSIAPELKNGQPYCPFSLDMWQIGSDLPGDFHTGIEEVDEIWDGLVSQDPNNRPTAGGALEALDSFLQKTPPGKLHCPGPKADSQRPVVIY